MSQASGAMPPLNPIDLSATPVERSDLQEFHDYAPWVNVFLGFAVFVSRFASPLGTFSVHWNLFLTGIVIMLAAFAATISHGYSSRNYWSAINVAAGAWLLISIDRIPSIPLVEHAQMTLGALVVVFGIASLVSEITHHGNAAARTGPSAALGRR
jgi:hypothetical protein